MDTQRLKGTAQKLKGSIKRAVGKLTGNKKLEARGTANHEAAAVRKAAGDAKVVPVKARPASK
jgi:uncharacterized protein YjbJ (UPF0337 family)